MIRLDDCIGRDVGGKAETLARARKLGLPVLDGIIVTAEETVDRAALRQVLDELGGEAFAVRSSSSIEDRPDASAAGVFESVIGARGVEGVLAAIERVRASAESEAARAYLETRGKSQGVRMNVLIQPVVEAELLGIARSFGGDERYLIEERAASQPEWGDVTARRLHRADPSPLAVGLNVLRRLVDAEIDVEFARTGDSIIYLQARAHVAPSTAMADEVFSLPGSWRRDAEHNPDPLSAAQAGLVALVEELGTGTRQEVLGGYLYVARARRSTPETVRLEELWKLFSDELVPDFNRQLGEAAVDGSVEAALATFCHVYRRYTTEISPALREVRSKLNQLLLLQLGEGLEQHGALLGGLGGPTLERDQRLWELANAAPSDEKPQLDAYLARYGACAPAWDVAVPCDEEVPERVLAAAEKWRAVPAQNNPAARHALAVRKAEEAVDAVMQRIDRNGRAELTRLYQLAVAVLPLAEADDLYFFRAQRLVRFALLKVARFLVGAGLLAELDDVFDLPIDSVRQAERDFRSRPRLVYRHLHDLAQKGRALRIAAGRIVPPVSIENGQPYYPGPPTGDVLRGHGTQGKARGRARVLGSLRVTSADVRDRILVVPAMLPSVSHLLPGVRALVTEHGGTTSHGATLAREYGIPAVLGVPRVTQLPDDCELFVDADAGRVYVLKRED